jgi:hypothetical protein
MLCKVLSSAMIVSLIGATLLTGCASEFELSYKPAKTSHRAPVASAATPVLIHSRYPDIDAKQFAREGYALIGTSDFFTGQLSTGPFEDSFYKDQAITQGMKIGAAIVLLQVDYTDVLGDGCCARVFASYWADLARQRAER